MEDNRNEMKVAAQTETPAERTDAAVEAPRRAAKQKKVSEELRRALIRCGAALLVALALLMVTRFSIFAIIKGPSETPSLESEKEGAFVKRDIYAIVGYSQDEKSGDAIVGEYAIVPMSGKFVTVHLPKRYLNAVDTVLQETTAYIEGNISMLDSFFVVDGTVSKLSDDQKKALSDWYAENKDYLVQTHVINDTDDETTYLSDALLEVDQINGMSQIFVIILSGLAGLCMAYILVELILMSCGYYLDSRVRERLAKANAVFAGATTEEIIERVRNGEPADDAASGASAQSGDAAGAPEDRT